MSALYCGYPAHPAADKFPMLDEGRLNDLAADIAANGLKVKIQLLDGQVIDGRNRARACELANVKPLFETIECDNPYKYVWSLNGNRRDLTGIQRSLIGMNCESGAAAFEAAKQEAEIKRKTAIAQAQTGNDNAKKTDDQNDSGHLFPTTDHHCPRQRNRENTAVAAVAAQFGVSRATMEKAITIRNSGEDNATAVIQGKAKPTEVLRMIRNEKKIERIQALPSGQYHVIYADPPWQYSDARAMDQYESTSAEHHYPTLSLDELKALDVGGLAAPDCVLFCWATCPLIFDAPEVLEAWGFTYKTMFIWNKGSGAFGHYHDASSELLLVATRGSGTPQIDKREHQNQLLPREGHSRKPAAWRDMIDRLYPNGPRIELFSRGEAPSGWDVWGAEAQPLEAAA
jgi:N6-adenosine-specific RNA methylase IME4